MFNGVPDLRLRRPAALCAAVLALALGQTALPPLAAAQEQAAAFQPALGQAQPFSMDVLTQRARDLAAQPYRAPVVEQPEVLEKIDYDAHWKIRFRPEATVRVGDVPVQFFHLGTYFRNPVRIAVVEDLSLIHI